MGETKHEGEKKAEEGAEKKDDQPVTVVLKMDLHCEGCAKKVRRAISHLEGVVKVKADRDAKKLTVTGNVDPTWLRERVESKTKKKVELISAPQPKKDGGGDEKAEEKSEKKAEEKKGDDKTAPKEAVVSTVVMKIKLHCEGCARKIKRVILRNIDGVASITTDLPKDLVTVTGTMDPKELAPYLKNKLRRAVDIVPPKKDDNNVDKKGREGVGGGGEEKKIEKEGGGGSHGGEKNEKEGDKGGGGSGDGGDKKESESKGEEGTKVEVNKMEHHGYYLQTHYAMPGDNSTAHSSQESYGVPMHHYQQQQQQDGGYYYSMPYPQGPPPPPPEYLNSTNDHMFSDENPNGCSLM